MRRNYSSIYSPKAEPAQPAEAAPPDLSAVAPVEGGRDWSKSRHPERRCTAHRKNGDQCKRAARLGTNVCDAHGARAPQVRRKAQQRLIEASDRMAKALIDIATSAESEPTRLAAVRDVLDRVGISSKTTVEVDVAVKPYERIISNISGVRAGSSRAESRARRGLPPAESDEPPVLDAEVIDDEPVRPPVRPAAERTGRKHTSTRPNPEPSPAGPYGEQKAPITGMAAIEAAAAANRAAGIHGKKRKRR